MPTGATAGGGGGGTGDSARRAARRRCSCGVSGGGRRARKLEGNGEVKLINKICREYRMYH